MKYSSTIPMRLYGVVCRNIINSAVHSPTVSGLLSCLSYGQGAPICKDGGVTELAFRTPYAHPLRFEMQSVVYQFSLRRLNHE